MIATAARIPCSVCATVCAHQRVLETTTACSALPLQPACITSRLFPSLVVLLFSAPVVLDFRRHGKPDSNRSHLMPFTCLHGITHQLSPSIACRRTKRSQGHTGGQRWGQTMSSPLSDPPCLAHAHAKLTNNLHARRRECARCEPSAYDPFKPLG